MTYYRWVWRTCWAALTLLLVVVGLIAGSVGAVLVAGVLAAPIGAVVGAALLQEDGGTRVPVALHRRVAARCGLRAGVAAGVLSASSAAVGSLVLPLVAVAALTSPPVVTLLLGTALHRWSEDAVPDAEDCGCGCADPVSAEEMRVLLTMLSDAELARAWRHSLTRLRQARSATEWSGLVALRTACLAELEDRDPVAVRRWLGSRPPAGTAPDLSRPSRATNIPVVPPPES